MRQAVMVGMVLPAALMLVSGCATKKWVTEYVGKKEVEIDQRFTGVDKKVTEETQRVDQKVEGVDTRLKSAEGSLTQTQQYGCTTWVDEDTVLVFIPHAGCAPLERTTRWSTTVVTCGSRRRVAHRPGRPTRRTAG